MIKSDFAKCFKIAVLLSLFSIHAFAQAPANDDFSNATLITTHTTCQTLQGSALNASPDFNNVLICNGGASQPEDVWYKFYADSVNADIIVQGIGQFKPLIVLYDAFNNFMVCNMADATTGIASINTASLISVGQYYYISISPLTTTGDFDFTVCVQNKTTPHFAKVTFVLDITPAYAAGIVNQGGVDMVGSFNSFNPTSNDYMSATSDTTKYTKTYTQLVQGDSIQYKFRLNHDWTTFEVSASRAYIANDGDTVKNVWGDPSITITDGTYKLPITFRVDMSNEVVSPNGVHISANFNYWTPDSTAMTPIGGGMYEATVNLDTSSVIRYKFTNGNSVSNVELVPSACGLVDGSGGYKRYFDVPEVATVLPTVCFGTCATCVTANPLQPITFKVDMSNETVSANGVHVFGNFNSWNPDTTVMNPIGGGIYQAIVSLDTTTTIRYKFINGNTNAEAEIVPAACGVISGSGGYKRQLKVPEQPSELQDVCFGACVNCASLGVNENKNYEKEINVAFNSLSDEIIIRSSLSSEKISFDMYDVSGKSIHPTENIELKNNVENKLSAKNIPQGLFFVTIKGNNFQVMKKLIVVR